MSKVQCYLCLHEENGFCSKKGTKAKPVKIELRKKRSCDLYLDDVIKVNDELVRQKMAAAKQASYLKSKNMFKLATTEENK